MNHLKILNLDPKTATTADREELQKEADKNPPDPIALNRLAVMQEQNGEFERRATTYEKLVKLIPENACVAIRLAVLDATKLNQAKKGLDLAKSAHTLAPDDPYITETLGRMVFEAHDYRYALSLLQDAACSSCAGAAGSAARSGLGLLQRGRYGQRAGLHAKGGRRPSRLPAAGRCQTI